MAWIQTGQECSLPPSLVQKVHMIYKMHHLYEGYNWAMDIFLTKQAETDA